MTKRRHWKLSATGRVAIHDKLKTMALAKVAGEFGVSRNALTSWLNDGHSISLKSRTALISRLGDDAVELEGLSDV